MWPDPEFHLFNNSASRNINHLRVHNNDIELYLRSGKLVASWSNMAAGLVGAVRACSLNLSASGKPGFSVTMVRAVTVPVMLFLNPFQSSRTSAMKRTTRVRIVNLFVIETQVSTLIYSQWISYMINTGVTISSPLKRGLTCKGFCNGHLHRKFLVF